MIQLDPDRPLRAALERGESELAIVVSEVADVGAAQHAPVEDQREAASVQAVEPRPGLARIRESGSIEEVPWIGGVAGHESNLEQTLQQAPQDAIRVEKLDRQLPGGATMALVVALELGDRSDDIVT